MLKNRSNRRALAASDGVSGAGLLRRAVERFGRIDVWVNNAVLAAVGRLEEVPPEANRRVVEANLLGYVHGAQAALPLFRRQGHGVLINMSSDFGLVGAPYAGAYTATKFAQRGLGQALRGELRGSGVHVCTVVPGGVDTPAYRLAANYSGRAMGFDGFLASPEKIARVVVRCAERPRPEVIVGNSVRTLRLAHALAPRIVERAAARTVERGLLRQEPEEPSPETSTSLRPSGPERTAGSTGRPGAGPRTRCDALPPPVPPCSARAS